MEYIPWIISGISVIVAIVFGVKNSQSKKQNEIRELRKDNKDLFNENKEIKGKYEELENKHKELEKQYKNLVESKPIEYDEYDEQLQNFINYNPKNF